jgi:NitT/TauT family transport system permease protein
MGIVAVFLLLWELASGDLIASIQWVDPFFMSSPSRVIEDLSVGLTSGSLLDDLRFTLSTASVGLLLGLVTGMAVGILFAYSKIIADLFEPFMSMLNSLPRPALAPIAILWFGMGSTSKIFIAWTMVFFVAFYNTYEGIRSIDSTVLDAVRVMKPSRLQVIRYVILPAVISWVFAALKLSVSMALIGTIIGEFVGSTKGLGYQLMTAQGLLQTDRVFSVFVLIAIVASTLLALAGVLEKRIVKWRPDVSLQ